MTWVMSVWPVKGRRLCFAVRREGLRASGVKGPEIQQMSSIPEGGGAAQCPRCLASQRAVHTCNQHSLSRLDLAGLHQGRLWRELR